MFFGYLVHSAFLTDNCPVYLKTEAKKVIMSAPNTDVPLFVVGISLGAYGTLLDMISNVSYVHKKEGLASLK
jgi:glyceraldehyde-3-phosphate dehydrogenase/erythrose-4-phosphate dehydrogenase